LFLIAVIVAVSSYRDGSAQFGAFRRLAFRSLPYAVVVIAALFFVNSTDNWGMVALEFAFYVALTWIIVWAVRKQWAKN
jgi:hypothetical protein